MALGAAGSYTSESCWPQGEGERLFLPFLRLPGFSHQQVLIRETWHLWANRKNSPRPQEENQQEKKTE